MMDELQDGLRWLYSLTSRGIKPGLDNTRELLRRLGDPHETFPTIHVAGSDGKGSVCAMLHSILSHAGLRVGIYTSPHLVRFNERIRVGNGDIDDSELLSLIERCRPTIDDMADEGMELTFFEIATAMAFLHFSSERVDLAVLETGMGGRLDSTNVVHPLLSVITPVGMEHKEHLGHNLGMVAAEKAGIIKPGVPVVANCSGEVRDVIDRKAKECGSKAHFLNEVDYSLVSIDREGVRVAYGGKEYGVGITGSFQAGNAATAILALKVLDDPRVDEKHIVKGLEDCVWPCRLELVMDDPPTVLDVTHTIIGAKALSEDFPKIYSEGNILVIGVLKDKDIEGLAELLGPHFRRVVATEPDTDRAMAACKVGRAFMHHCDDVTVEEKVGDAIGIAQESLRTGESVLVTGSLYTAGDALKWLEQRTR